LKRENIWNVPNMLTMLRLLLIGVFIWLFRGEMYFAALATFLLAGVTDFLDGYIARKWNLITSFGKLADPLADKLMLIAALACLTTIGVVPWWVVAAVIFKELLMVLGSVVAYKKGVVVYARFIGKASTGLFVAAVAAAFFHRWIAPWDAYLLYIAVALSVGSMVFYGINLLNIDKTSGSRYNDTRGE